MIIEKSKHKREIIKCKHEPICLQNLKGMTWVDLNSYSASLFLYPSERISGNLIKSNMGQTLKNVSEPLLINN